MAVLDAWEGACESLVSEVGVKDLQELFARHGICRCGKGIDRGLARPTSPC